MLQEFETNLGKQCVSQYIIYLTITGSKRYS